MATHSSILSWEITQTEMPNGLWSMRSQRESHNLATKQKQTTIARAFQLQHSPYKQKLMSHEEEQSIVLIVRIF